MAKVTILLLLLGFEPCKAGMNGKWFSKYFRCLAERNNSFLRQY